MNSNNDTSSSGSGGGEEPDRTGTQEPGTRPTRNIMVSIQYAFVSGLRLGANGGNPEEGTGDGATMPPIGDFVLNFTDVPGTATREQLDEVVALASGVAVNRMNRRFNRSRGISKTAFENLPVLKFSAVPQESCSICYDDFEDEAPEPQPENEQSRKRSRDHKADDGLHSSSSSKKHRSERDSGQSSEDDEETGGEEPTPAPSTSEPPKENEADTNNQESIAYKHSPLKLPCGHIFGRECIRQWTNEHNTCPICRARIVGADGLEDHSVNDDLEDQISLERIRRLLYDTSPEAPERPQPTNEDNNNSTSTTTSTTTNDAANDTTNNTTTNPSAGSQVPGVSANGNPPALGGAFHNFVVLRPHQQPATDPANSEQPNPGNLPTNPHLPLLPLLTRQGGFTPIPITFINLRRNPQGQQHTASRNNDGPNDLNDSQMNPSNNTHRDINTHTDNNQENDRLMNIFDHLFSISNNTRPQPEATLRSDATPMPAGTPDSSQTDNQSNSAAPRPIRSHIFNNLFRFARNLRNNSTPQSDHPLSSVSQMFNTGVASFRNQDGVSTMDFSGDMPTPANTHQNQSVPTEERASAPSSESQGRVNDSSDSEGDQT
ncbi:ubiquitin-protein ligase SAN1 [Lachancea thermotolerans CBS 6340]|uniref:KLTH0G12408p n=1 Tax=Lachancea thermotolerans (strain ATCC 56472 / CBS 6340 / NRRL Y-8284) TaxID=559295 RepID=C5DMX4_LACTC|nr:KLTH0G12408p [Lachancea thermotolerans CBS 6340]CAR25135.1 KLTH0G12408p [Lachancea thermotolerans CBS 6340]